MMLRQLAREAYKRLNVFGDHLSDTCGPSRAALNLDLSSG